MPQQKASTSWTKPQDVKDRALTGLYLPTDQQLQVFIDDIELQILTRFPKIQERIDGGLLSEKLIVQTVSNIIIEFLQTEGKPYSQESQAYAGAASRSVTYGGSARTTLKLTESDLGVFKPNLTGPRVIDFASTAHVSYSHTSPWRGSRW